MSDNFLALSLRPESLLDTDFLANLYRSTREDMLHIGLPGAMLDNLIGMQFRAQQDSYRQRFPHGDFSIVEIEGRPIGRLITSHGDESLRLVFIALLPQERNQGFGRRLLQSLQASAAATRKPLELSVDTMNVQAKRLYLSLGFQIRNDNGASLEMIWRADEDGSSFRQGFFA